MRKAGLVRSRVAVVTGLAFSALCGCACSRPLPTMDIAIREAVLKVEVAADPASRACGLASRDSLPQDQGMLFVLPEPDEIVFWMQDTRIPLSIAFLDEQGRILDNHQTRPLQGYERYRSSAPALYAIEVNKGWFESHGVAEGELVDIRIPEHIRIR